MIAYEKMLVETRLDRVVVVGYSLCSSLILPQKADWPSCLSSGKAETKRNPSNPVNPV
jgi:hypothetical protein